MKLTLSDIRRSLCVAAFAAVLTACATPQTSGDPKATKADGKVLPKALDPRLDMDPFPSTYRPLPSGTTVIKGATILTATNLQIENGVIVIAEGKIVAVGGPETAVPAGATVIDAAGKWITPGIIDAHSHLGVFPSPSVSSRWDGNEMSDPVTAGVWAEHSVWPQDPGFDRARAGGVTAMLILPGSANLIGGRSVTLKNIPSVTTQGMKFPGAPYGVKMACGENPKRTHGGKGKLPSTAMGNVLGYRKAWAEAAEYSQKWDAYRKKVEKDPSAEPPKRDFALDTLAGVRSGEILVHNHCYRADEMATMIDLSHEFGYHITAFHHAIEAYKVGPMLAKEDVCVAIWAERGGFKMEALDSIAENAALVHRAGGCVIVHSDDEILIQHLNQEAAIALGAALQAGIPITKAEAIAWITRNPAKALGIVDRTGSLEAGKMADVVLWSGDPFSVYSVTEKVFVDGALAYDRHDPRYQSRSDFQLGQPGAGAFHP